VETASASLPGGGRGRAGELDRVTNFARTSMSALRGWVRAGNDITHLAVAKLTKAQLAIEREPRPPTVARLKVRAEGNAMVFIESVKTLAAQDKAAAIAMLEVAMSQLATQGMLLGLTAVQDAKQAAKETRLLRVGRQTFFPVDSEIRIANAA
jgi:hypothetical protein